MALTTSGELFTWGEGTVECFLVIESIGETCMNYKQLFVTIGRHGELGHGDSDSVTAPRACIAFLNEGVAITKVAVGEHHSTAIDNKGKLYTWGEVTKPNHSYS